MKSFFVRSGMAGMTAGVIATMPINYLISGSLMKTGIIAVSVWAAIVSLILIANRWIDQNLNF